MRKIIVSIVLTLDILFFIYLLWNLGIAVDEQMLVSEFVQLISLNTFSLTILIVSNIVALISNFIDKT